MQPAKGDMQIGSFREVVVSAAVERALGVRRGPCPACPSRLSGHHEAPKALGAEHRHHHTSQVAKINSLRS